MSEARADLWKRTNFEIPNEINAVRVPCRGGPGGEEAHRSDGLGAGTVSKRSLGHGRGVSFLLGNLMVRGTNPRERLRRTNVNHMVGL